MPFTVSPSSYRGGDYLFQGLSGFGSNLGSGIGQAIQDYQKRQKMVDQYDAAANLMGNTMVTDPKTGKPVPLIAPERMALIQGETRAHKAALGGELLGAYKTLQLMGQGQQNEQRYPIKTSIGDVQATSGQALNFISEVDRRAYEEKQKVAVPIPGTDQIVKTSPATAVSAGAERERLRLAQTPKPVTPAEERAQREEQRKIREAWPETQFTKKYSLQPKDVFGVIGKDVYHFKDEKGNVVGQVWGPGTPSQGTFGRTMPSDIPTGLKIPGISETRPEKAYWEAAPGSPFFRENKIDVTKKGADMNAKVQQYQPNPYGTLANIKGQHIPLSEIDAINNRGQQVYAKAADVISRAAAIPDPAQRQQVIERAIGVVQSLGYDPKLIPGIQ